MKLKLIVASMSVLGLISATAYAQDPDVSMTSTTTTVRTTPQHVVKHRKCRSCKHRAHREVTMRDYKDGAIVVEVPRVDNFQIIYDAMGQNLNRGHVMPDWFNRIGVSGGINFDAHWGNRQMGYMGENVKRVSLNDAFLNTTAIVNDWARAFASFSFTSASGLLSDGVKDGMYSNVYTNEQLNLEQGFITFANYDESPFFFQIGKQFTDFGRYQIHPIERTMTQVESESLQTSAKLGFITRMGLHGQVYAFDNGMTRFTEGHPKTVYGAALGFDQINDQLGWDVGIGYMSQLVGANDVQYAVGTFNGTIAPGSTTAGGVAGSFVHTVGGLALYGDLMTGPFALSARYVRAIQEFSATDLTTIYQAPGPNAQPWTFDITGGFGFNNWGKNQNIYIGYQHSAEAVNLYLPMNRWIIGYNVDMWKNTNLGLEVGHDIDYGTSRGGTGNSSNTIGARASVRFG